MSKAAGLFLILSGLTVAAYGIPSDKDASEPEVASRTAATPVPAFATSVVVTIAQRPSMPPAAPPRAAPILRDRDTLARELQKELKRVGCYEGELNGAWTPLTRRAMKAFTDQVNATLPVHEPDAILYALVQGHQDRACGKPCPSGQGLDEDGRCLPNAILAKAAKKDPPRAAMPLSPKSHPAAAETAATAVAGWSTVTTSAGRRFRLWQLRPHRLLVLLPPRGGWRLPARRRRRHGLGRQDGHRPQRRASPCGRLAGGPAGRGQ